MAKVQDYVKQGFSKEEAQLTIDYLEKVKESRGLIAEFLEAGTADKSKLLSRIESVFEEIESLMDEDEDLDEDDDDWDDEDDEDGDDGYYDEDDVKQEDD